ncbi:putative retrotransposable element tf2 155 kda protein type 1-like [Lyophyllum shimeji]|uniref:RNA-directed DNA polymerase n=1 Tax=Lyophyllum shimeji TaxID=47721 RepID=A0A9P3Q1Z6_LYOSH|nr:putative retrotransposable element tf2 155 kda protein type 1-like [Lyophyllum shimeji]
MSIFVNATASIYPRAAQIDFVPVLIHAAAYCRHSGLLTLRRIYRPSNCLGERHPFRTLPTSLLNRRSRITPTVPHTPASSVPPSLTPLSRSRSRSPSASPSPSPSSSSSSSSDSFIHIAAPSLPGAHHNPPTGLFSNHISVNMGPRSTSSVPTATVELRDGKVPVLHPGDLTPKVMKDWERGCLTYFRTKEVKEEDQVLRCTIGIRDDRICDWLAGDHDRIVKLSFQEFMNEMRVNYLPHDWPVKTRGLILNHRLDPATTSFWDYAAEMQAMNSLLVGTSSWFDTKAEPNLLRDKIEAGLDEDLSREYWASKTNLIKDWHQWLDAVRTLDETRHHNLKRQREIADEAIRAAKRPLVSSRSVNASTPNSSSFSRRTAANASSAPAATARARLPTLTAEEKTLLREHNGCFKCRRFYTTCESLTCTTGFPDAATYRTLTAADAAAAKKKVEASSAPPSATATSASSSSGRSRTVKPVAAVWPAGPSSSSWADTSVRGSTVAAVLPDVVTSGVLSGTDTESEGEGSDSDDSDVSTAPLSVPHYVWPATISGPNVETPVNVSNLIDNGSHVVLIHADLAEHLGLRRFRLHEPLEIDLAMSPSNSSPASAPAPTILSEYCKVSLTSLNQAWTSDTVRALIAPNLCASLILGLPFLTHNHLVIDHAERSIVDKRCNYNLLNPVTPVPKRTIKRVPMRTAFKKTQADRKTMVKELKTVCDARRERMEREGKFEKVKEINVVTAIQQRIKDLCAIEKLQKFESAMKTEFRDIFEPIPHVNELPRDVLAEIHLQKAEQSIRTRTYQCPRKYREAWKTLIAQHLEAGRIRPSSSQFASPAFIIPKADPTVLPRWVNDYRELNANTVPDNHPIPRVDDILHDCAKGKYFSTIDMTNSFFQTPMHPDHVHLTAVSTPFGLYEWLVMPMGLRNAPAIHQRRVSVALREYIGKICHVYLDDIVIYSQTLEEHHVNIRKILQALRDARLYVNPAKTHLYCTSINFLGHHISAAGIEADGRKVGRILAWPRPKTATEVRSFLGLVRYIAAFLPHLADHTDVLNELTHKDCDVVFPEWLPKHQVAFDAIKQIVVSRECLTTIDHDDPTKSIFVTTDASDRRSGAVLSWGDSWESARPVAFDSSTFKGAELNYPVHEKELLVIIRALRKWRADLFGAKFTVLTDHRTLENFGKQRDLSRRQARWMEFLSQFDCKIVYVKGEDNSVADALSRLPDDFPDSADTVANAAALADMHDAATVSRCIAAILPVCRSSSPFAATFSLAHRTANLEPVAALTPAGFRILPAINMELVEQIKAGYDSDPWCKNLIAAARGMPALAQRDGLWFWKSRLVVPRAGSVRETIFRLAHDALGHFGFEKSYAAMRDSYYWPKMRRDLELGYIPACRDCQRMKSSTVLPSGPLHPLPVPDGRCESVAMDFIGPLPEDSGKNCILTITDRMHSDIKIIATRTDITASDLAELFFDHWYCDNGLPTDIVCDRDKLFVSKFWKALSKLIGVKVKMSSAYHPETDGVSERSNKTVNQALRFHVDRNQRGWRHALPRVRFEIMNTVNKSTGFSPFQLKTGRSPRVIPPLIAHPPSAEPEEVAARDIVERLKFDTATAQDNLIQAKIQQASQANKSRLDDFAFRPGDRVRLSTKNRRRAFKQAGQTRVAKFMPRFDGPYTITAVQPEASTVTVMPVLRHRAFVGLLAS